MSEWINVNVQPPPVEVDVLCKRETRPPIVAGWWVNGFYTFDDDQTLVKNVTHWMPLP